ncbi:hypothetical protein FA95DRAFT_989063 [Auriscalpium vulgare]|uniref:Uncharacterized protein n=1 Tax=Auriscalpium vulgare TaxID=40419 RepID=A0ACB8RXL2_9AGAM|nr:hypothetical protein FA95DRAFT_989063 [Auriscalpium vulgare]
MSPMSFLSAANETRVALASPTHLGRLGGAESLLVVGLPTLGHGASKPPITRIPVEILREILLWFVRSKTKAPERLTSISYDPSILTTHVCRHWRNLVLGEAVFWMHVSLPRVAPSVELFLERSGERHISVFIDLSAHAHMWEDSRCKDAGSRVLEEMSRFKEFSLVDVDSDNDGISPSFGTSTHQVCCACARGLVHDGYQDAEANVWSAPLPGCPCVASTGPQSNQFLSFVLCNLRTDDYAEFVVNLLARLPALEEFYCDELLCNGSRRSTIVDNTAVSPLPVAKLHRLRLVSISQEWQDTLQVARHLDLRFTTDTRISLNFMNEAEEQGEEHIDGDHLGASLAQVVSVLAGNANISFTRLHVSKCWTFGATAPCLSSSAPSPSCIDFELNIGIANRILSKDKQEQDLDAWSCRACKAWRNSIFVGCCLQPLSSTIDSG